MKKIVSLVLAMAMSALLVACGSESEPAASVADADAVEATETTEADATPKTVTLTTRNGAGEEVQVEFPYNPERIAVLDMAALDILDNLGISDPIVGVAKSSSIDYLQSYIKDDSLVNLGNVKEADLEAVMASDPEVIFIGGRMSAMYDQLAAIAPVYVVYTDMSKGVVASTVENATNIATMFGVEDQVAALVDSYNARIEALQKLAEGKTAVVGMVNAGGFGVLGNDGRCSIIGREIGFENVGVSEGSSTSAHGNESSFELVVSLDPDYIFVMDRDAAIGTQGAQLAAEVMDNELINKTAAAQNGNVIILEHSNVWYTAEGGITALGIMLEDLEKALK